MSSPSTSMPTTSSDKVIPSKVARLDGENESSVAAEDVTVINVKTNDDKVFTVDFELLKQSKLIKDMVDYGLKTGPDVEPLLLKNVDGIIFEKILEWCEQHKGEAEYDIDDPVNRHLPLPSWDQEWFSLLGYPPESHTIYDIIKAANYMEIKILLDLSTKVIAGLVLGKTAEEIREIFGVKNDFTPEEEAAFDADPIWCDQI